MFVLLSDIKLFEIGERIKAYPDLIEDELKEKNSKNISLTRK